MALLVHLPLNGDLHNQGLADVEVTNNGATVDNNGKIGKCYSFDGYDDYISLDSPILYSTIKGGSIPFSISMWIYCADSTRGILFGDYRLTGAINFNVELTASQQLRFYWGGNDTIASTAIVPLNSWTHIALVYDGKTINFYVNGVLLYNRTIILDTKNKTAGSYYLGRDSRVGDTAFNGKINDVRIYSHCLSQKEISELKKMLILHYPLDGNNGTLANPNFALGTSPTNASSGYYSLSPTISSGTKVTISCRIDADDVVLTGNKRIGLSSGIVKSDGSGTQWFEAWISERQLENGSYHGYISNTTTVLGNMTTIGVYVQTASSGTVSISQVKVEIGNKATSWCPNSSDALYTALGYNDGIEYDTSGYGNNGTKVGTLTYSIDSPRYLASTVFDGNNSCVRTSNNNWISRPLEEFTVNVWAYKDDWTTYGGQRLFSCTEGAGFNTEQLNSAISFPILVYKNEARTTKGYTDNAYRPLIPLSSISSGWHMFTFTYSTSKISSYLDGTLVDSKAYTSYGTYCGDNIPLCIGAEATSNFGTAGGMFVGKMSDFRLYYTCLSDTEIQKLYTVSASIDSNGNAYSAAYVEG